MRIEIFGFICISFNVSKQLNFFLVFLHLYYVDILLSKIFK